MRMDGSLGPMTTTKTRWLLVGLVCLALWPALAFKAIADDRVEPGQADGTKPTVGTRLGVLADRFYGESDELVRRFIPA